MSTSKGWVAITLAVAGGAMLELVRDEAPDHPLEIASASVQAPSAPRGWSIVTPADPDPSTSEAPRDIPRVTPGARPVGAERPPLELDPGLARPAEFRVRAYEAVRDGRCPDELLDEAEEMLRQPEEAEWRTGLWLLLESGRSSALDALERFLFDPDVPPTRKDLTVDALGQRADPECARRLEAYSLGADSSLRETAGRALSNRTD